VHPALSAWPKGVRALFFVDRFGLYCLTPEEIAAIAGGVGGGLGGTLTGAIIGFAAGVLGVQSPGQWVAELVALAQVLAPEQSRDQLLCIVENAAAGSVAGAPGGGVTGAPGFNAAHTILRN